MDSGTKQTAKDATDATHPQILRLRNPNPMKDVPDQDSAKSLENNFSNLVVPTLAILGIYGT